MKMRQKVGQRRTQRGKVDIFHCPGESVFVYLPKTAFLFFFFPSSSAESFQWPPSLTILLGGFLNHSWAFFWWYMNYANYSNSAGLA